VSSSVGITGETFTVQNETCANSCNGSVAVSPVGGAAPITYSWIAPPANTSTLNNLCAGVYFVQMTDNNGCIRTASTTVGSVSAMTISPFVIQPSCGSSNGTISINISGGTPSYSINWSAPIVSTATTVTGLGAGIYSVTVTDAGGCSQTQAFNLSNSTAPVITYTQSNITCFGLCTGSIIAAGISTDTPLTYNWSNGNTTPTVTGLCTGVVSLTISSNSGCKAIQTFTLTQNPSMQLSISNITQPKCFNDCNGDITLVPSGGTLPYTFTWTPIAVTGNPQFSLCPGNYTATVIDARGCFTTTTANLINPPQFTVSNTFTNSSCSTSSDGIAIETAAGGTGTLSYSWSGPNSFSASTSSISGVTSGNYTVLVTDARGCTATDSVKIVPTITLVANAGSNPTVCLNGSVTLDGSPSTGSIAGYSWIQLPNNTSTIATTPSVIVSPGVGTTSYVLQVISTGSACIDTQMVLVNVYPLPQVSAGTSTTIPLFTSIMIGGSPTSPTGISFSWTPAFTLDNPVNPNPTASNTINTTYTVFVTDANGCTASDTIRVDIYPEIKIPNGFSPNGDGKNDMWVIDNIDQFPDCVVEVYNRWGERLYYAPKGYSPLFNGKYKGSDLPVGTYYYIINLNHPAYPKAYTGPLTIFR
jgi:gliding motility-associated-like protein